MVVPPKSLRQVDILFEIIGRLIIKPRNKKEHLEITKHTEPLYILFPPLMFFSRFGVNNSTPILFPAYI